LAVVASLVAQPVLAAAPLAAPQQTDKSHPDATSYRVTCAEGACSIALDLGGEMQSASEVPADMPIKLELPPGVVPFLAKGAGVEIGDSIDLTLPFGSIKMEDGDFSLHLDENGNLDRLHGKSASIVPSLNLGPNLQIAGPFGAEVGYDYGSTLSGLSTVLDPQKRYLFFHLGSGLELDAEVPGASADGEPMRFTVPEGDTFSIVIDPESALLYLDGRLTLAQITDVGMLLGLMGLAPTGIPLLSGLVLPTRTTIGVGGLLSPDMSKNFLQITGGMGINGGPLARLLRIEGEPLGFDGLLRVDSGGLLLGGVAKSALNPDQVLDTRGELSLYIPFTLGELPYLQVGGKLRVPVVGLETEIAQQIGGGAISELTSSNALLESTAEAANAWWNKTGPWMAGVASVVAGGSRSLLDALQDAAEDTSDAMGGGASTVWNTVRDRTGKVIEGAGSVAGAGVDGAGKALQAAGSAVGAGAATAGEAIKGAGTAVSEGTGKVLAGAGGAVSAGAQGATDALKGAGSAVGAGAAGAAAGAASAAAGAADAAKSAAAAAAASGAAAGASAALDNTTAAANCAAQQARNLWCQTTRLCEVQEVICE
jgi:hypothetical protein